MLQSRHKLRDDISGVSAVEFALVLPFVILLLLGGYELTEGINTDRRVTAVARTVADLTAQNPEQNISKQEMTNLILNAGKVVFAPYDSTKIKIVVSGVRVDADRKATIAWSTSTDNAVAEQHKAGNAAPISDNLRTANTNLVWAQVSYPYTPMFGAVLTGEINLREALFMRPRVVECLKYDSKGCT